LLRQKSAEHANLWAVVKITGDFMLVVENPWVTDPHLNLALEEHLLRNVLREEPIFLFYVNEPAVIVGRNQNVLEEVDLTYVRSKGIHVVRRLSGGGTVYHDFGNLNYSMLLPGQERLHDFAYFTAVLSHALREFGLQTELRNRSSLFIDSRKISGNAQYAPSGRLVSHGTLLFDTDLEAMLRAINPQRGAIESRAVQSVRSQVVNLRELLPADVTMHDLRQAILRSLERLGPTAVLHLTADDWAQVHKLAGERYQTWEWNIGRSPRFTVTNQVLLGEETLAAEIVVDKGCIREVTFTAPQHLQEALALLTTRLPGVRYDPAALESVIAQVLNESADGRLTARLLLNLLY
jgi:lipoate-protein ligase A